METAEQQENRGPHEEALVDSRDQPHFRRHDLFVDYRPFEAISGGVFSHWNSYETTPKLSPMENIDELSGNTTHDEPVPDIGKVAIFKGASRPKVRSGCYTCKTRRLKCDEGRPECNRCIRSSRICPGYPTLPPDKIWVNSGVSKDSLSGSSSSPTASLPHKMVEPISQRLVEPITHSEANPDKQRRMNKRPSLSRSASLIADSDKLLKTDLKVPHGHQPGDKVLRRTIREPQARVDRRNPSEVTEIASSESKPDSYQTPIQQIGSLPPSPSHIIQSTLDSSHVLHDLTSNAPAKSQFSMDEQRPFEATKNIESNMAQGNKTSMKCSSKERGEFRYEYNSGREVQKLDEMIMFVSMDQLNVERLEAVGQESMLFRPRPIEPVGLPVFSTYFGEPSSSLERHYPASLDLKPFPSNGSESVGSSDSPVDSEYFGYPAEIERLSGNSSSEPTLRDSSLIYKCPCGFEPAGAERIKLLKLKSHQKTGNCRVFSQNKRPETKIYQCPYSSGNDQIQSCKKWFPRADYLRRHIRLQHGNVFRTVNEAVGDDHALSPGLFSSPSSLIDPELLETKVVPSAEFHAHQPPSSIFEHNSENLFEDSTSRHQLKTSSTVLYRNNETITTCQVQDTDRPLSPILDCRIAIDPITGTQGGSSSSRNNTLSSFTEDETDGGEDEANNSIQDLEFSSFSSISQDCPSEARIKDSLKKAVFSPMKQALIDRIMKEFWVIFNQETEAIQNRSPASFVVESAGNRKCNTDKNCERGECSPQNPGSKLSAQAAHTSEKATQSTLGPRKRDDGDDQEQNDGEEQSPKRPRALMTPPQNPEDTVKFACPYRKRDPRTYCVQLWRSCALTPQDTVARVKGHLYRHHRIYPCQRCKALFENQDAVNQHLMQRDVCELRDTEYVDGITTENYEKLRSKKKAQRDQTEADRWKDIFKLLFPGEIVPSPYFEAVQEEIVLSPDSRELADYEAYCRRELPRTFRAALEEIVHNESQPMEESVRNQLTNIIRDCQDRVFSRYRSTSTVNVAVGSPSRCRMDSHSPVKDHSQESINPISMASNAQAEDHIAPSFFQPPSPQAHLRSRFEVSDLQLNSSRAPDGSAPSDSGYSSNEFGNTSGIMSSSSNICYIASMSDSRSDVAPAALPASVEATWNMNSDHFTMDSGNGASDPNDTSTFEGSYNNSFDNNFDGLFENPFDSNSQYGSQLTYESTWGASMGNLGVENPFSSDETL